MEIETDRLRLRLWRESDFEDYAAYYSDPVLARFVGGVCDRETAWRKMASLAGHWALLGFGYWAVEEKDTGTFVGCVGLWESDGWPELELGYWLVPETHGKGYATEAAKAAMRYAREELKAESLVSYIDPGNVPSQKVSERLGGTFENTIELLTFGPHRVYRYDMPSTRSG